jgi:integrase
LSDDSKTFTFTDQAVKALLAPGEYRDKSRPGLVLRVRESGAKSWSVVYFRGRRKRVTLGPVKKLSLADAGAAAKRIAGAVAIGQDPQAIKLSTRAQERAEKAKAKLVGKTFATTIERWIAAESEHWKPTTRAGWTRYARKEIAPALGAMAPDEIRPAHVQALIGRIEKGTPGPADKDGKATWKRKPAPVSARRCFEVVRRLFVWCVAKGIVESSPCDAAKSYERSRKSGKKRDGKKPQPFSDVQLRAIHTATRKHPDVGFFDLILYTGVRAHEARSAKFADIDERRKLWTVPAELHKVGAETGHPHLVPLSDAALAVVTKAKEGTGGRGWLFPAPTSSCEACEQPGHLDKPRLGPIKKAAGITDRGLLHRLRHTIKTRMSEHGIDARVSELVLGHVVPGIQGTYDHAQLIEPRREALNWWASELAAILAAKG